MSSAAAAALPSKALALIAVERCYFLRRCCRRMLKSKRLPSPLLLLDELFLTCDVVALAFCLRCNHRQWGVRCLVGRDSAQVTALDVHHFENERWFRLLCYGSDGWGGGGSGKRPKGRKVVGGVRGCLFVLVCVSDSMQLLAVARWQIRLSTEKKQLCFIWYITQVMMC